MTVKIYIVTFWVMTPYIWLPVFRRDLLLPSLSPLTVLKDDCSKVLGTLGTTRLQTQELGVAARASDITSDYVSVRGFVSVTVCACVDSSRTSVKKPGIM
jgi:hypothetical protein